METGIKLSQNGHQMEEFKEKQLEIKDNQENEVKIGYIEEKCAKRAVKWSKTAKIEKNRLKIVQK